MGEPPVNDDGIFDQNFARSYDRNHGATDPKLIRKTVDVLERHAAGGEALEFAVGTGRIALPLAARGVPVKGIELSKAMVAELRRKETGTAMDVTIGDMTTTRMPGAFSLVYLVFNTIDNLTSQDAQVACFENAATHLQPNGRFLVETLVPPIQNIPFGETNHAFECSPTHWGIDTYDIGGSVCATYYASTEAPVFETSQGPMGGVACGVAEWPEDIISLSRDIRQGKAVRAPWLLCASPSVVDPSRAPEGQHWFKILAEHPPELAQGRDWEKVKLEIAAQNLERIGKVAPNLKTAVILDSLTKSPIDIEADNPHMIRGSMHGGSRSPAFSGSNRPVPGWAQHRMPIPGLYQTGATTHPGGSITGFPGRNAAIVMLQDFGIDPVAAMSAKSGR